MPSLWSPRSGSARQGGVPEVSHFIEQLLRGLRHPIEAIRGWWQGVDEPDWRTRLLKPFLLRQAVDCLPKDGGTIVYKGESWDYKWSREEEEGWEKVGTHPLHNQPGRKSKLLRRRIK